MERAIQSVLSQTFEDWEHIIVNDCGNIERLNILLNKYIPFYNGRLKVIHNNVSQGMEFASNLGLKQAEGGYFVIHDDDDSWQSDFLQKTVIFFEAHPSFGAVVTNINYFLEEIKNNKIITHHSYPCIRTDEITLYNLLLSQNYPSPIASLFKIECLKTVGYFNKNLKKGGDKEYLLRVAARYNISIIQEPLANYYARPYDCSVYANSTLANDAFEDAIFWEQELKNQFFKNNLSLWFFYNFVEFIRPFLQKNKIKNVLDEAKGQKIALYGAGMKAIQLLKDHKNEFNNLDIIAIFDQNLQKQGAFLDKYMISAPEQIAEIKPEKIIITVANVSMVKAFIEKLIEQNSLACKIVSLDL
ncbi:MAG: glycosyltransferase family A protein [Candidatus Gastranaerophilales bacterium]|nr:glycosyltransferase family A protein [Candidatus Gastranaerophilales bacterium]